MVKQYLNTCNFFLAQSKFVWDRIGFARHMNLRISETTITEDLIFRFYRSYLEETVPVRIFESVEEHQNGSDVEFLIKTQRGYILLACQAKIIYKTGGYKSFSHKVRGIPQIDLLRTYAGRTGGIALYLFYNHLPEWKMSPACLVLPSIDTYGLTFISADEIFFKQREVEKSGKKAKIPNFNALHPSPAIPFHLLVCALLEESQPFNDLFPETDLKKLTYYTEAEIKSSEDWHELTRVGQIGFVESDIRIDGTTYLKKFPNSGFPKQVPSFNPKYRVVIGNNSQ